MEISYNVAQLQQMQKRIEEMMESTQPEQKFQEVGSEIHSMLESMRIWSQAQFGDLSYHDHMVTLLDKLQEEVNEANAESPHSPEFTEEISDCAIVCLRILQLAKADPIKSIIDKWNIVKERNYKK